LHNSSLDRAPAPLTFDAYRNNVDPALEAITLAK